MAKPVKPLESSPLSLEYRNQITSWGERVTHLYPNDCFYAHLSIYYFALEFCQNSRVLDAGSGTGYGSAYLADHGAHSVLGIDISTIAIKFSQQNFQRPNLEFRAMDLQRIQGLPSRSFDFIFTSNALEHIPDVLPFIRSAWQVLKQEGTMLIAVPPVIDEVSRGENVANPYHLNIWSPQQWHYILHQYFSDIQCYGHHGNRQDRALNFSNTPEQCVITEKDFVFEPLALDQFSTIRPMTAIFVVRNPRLEEELPAMQNSLTFVDDSFTRSEAIAAAPLEGAPPTPFWRLIFRGFAILFSNGPSRLWREIKQYLAWRLRL